MVNVGSESEVKYKIIKADCQKLLYIIVYMFIHLYSSHGVCVCVCVCVCVRACVRACVCVCVCVSRTQNSSCHSSQFVFMSLLHVRRTRKQNKTFQQPQITVSTGIITYSTIYNNIMKEDSTLHTLLKCNN